MDSVLTALIVLRKQPYQENGLLLTGLSPDYGRLSLLLRGAQNPTPKKPVQADVFRELEVNFLESGRSQLRLADKVELLTAFDSLAESPRNYRFAAKIGDFLLKNSTPDLPMPYTYDVLRNSLLQLLVAPGTDGKWTPLETAVTVKMTYLYESGLLPEITDERESEFLESLVAAGIEGTVLPEAPEEYYQQLTEWLDRLLEYHKLAK